MTGEYRDGGGSDWSDHRPTDPELTSGARDGFTLQVNNTQLFFKSREGFPMLALEGAEDGNEVRGAD